MRAAWIEKFGGLDVIQVGERPMPAREPGEVLVKLHASTLNHRDVYLRRGEAGRIALPVILGSDGAGTVVEADLNSQFVAGQRVAIFPVLSCGACINCRGSSPHKCCNNFGMIGGERDGTHAEFTVVPEGCLVSLPEGLDFEDAAAISLAGLTAWNMVVDVGQIESGEHALVLGASGGVGVFILALLKQYGAIVHVVTSSLEKSSTLRELGADSVLNDSPADVLRFTRTLNNRGVDLAFNHVGGNTWRYVPATVRAGGRILVCGSLRSPVAEIDMRQIFYRNISLLGCSMGNQESLISMLGLAAIDQSLRIPISHRIDLSDIVGGHELLESGRAMGKVVIKF